MIISPRCAVGADTEHKSLKSGKKVPCDWPLIDECVIFAGIYYQDTHL